MTAQKPDTFLAVICGALHVGSQNLEQSHAMYLRGLERGQVMARDFLKNTVRVELIYGPTKYIVYVTKTGKQMYTLELNK